MTLENTMQPQNKQQYSEFQMHDPNSQVGSNIFCFQQKNSDFNLK